MGLASTAVRYRDAMRQGKSYALTFSYAITSPATIADRTTDCKSITLSLVRKTGKQSLGTFKYFVPNVIEQRELTGISDADGMQKGFY
jgi:hypothetical protein